MGDPFVTDMITEELLPFVALVVPFGGGVDVSSELLVPLLPPLVEPFIFLWWCRTEKFFGPQICTVKRSETTRKTETKFTDWCMEKKTMKRRDKEKEKEKKRKKKCIMVRL